MNEWRGRLEEHGEDLEPGEAAASAAPGTEDGGDDDPDGGGSAAVVRLDKFRKS